MVPASPLGHETTQVEPAAHSVWQGPDRHVNSQLLSAPHSHVPLAHSPAQLGLPPTQVVWQGDASHVKAHSLPVPHSHSPFAQLPLHDAASPHVTWQGGLWQVKSQLAPSPQSHCPFPHSPLQDGLSPSHTTEHGGAAHSKSHAAPAGQTQVPSAQSCELHPTHSRTAATR